ncbi:hypothetical protein [Botrimarina sp.]|uniref:hypothetical protein n=1 Tax=Botrimarina sp. TaxID=2795802 RepID=UPI0032EFEBF3
MRTTTWFPAVLLMAAAPMASAETLTPYWFDGYDLSQDAGTANGFSSFNINAELGAPRQGGPLVPTAYVTNTADPTNDFRHQLFPPSNGVQPLQLAGDGFLPGAAPTLASPDLDFSGPAGADVLGKRVTFSLDAASLILQPGNPASAFVQAGVTLGSANPLVAADAIGGPKFGVLFIEDTFSGNGAFLQFFNGEGLVQNLIANPAGFGPMDVQIDIDDPLDGDPWNGVGSTVFEVSVNGMPVGAPQEFGGGGLTSNYLTLLAGRDFVSNATVTHLFDNLTVFSGPAIPEPSAAGLATLGLAGAAARRRSKP